MEYSTSLRPAGSLWRTATRALMGGLLLLTISCASGDMPQPSAAPPAAPVAADARLAELQVSMTELLERLDVLNDRLARLEEERVVTAAAAPAAAPLRPRPVADTPARPAEPTPVPPTQRALVGAQLATDYRDAIALYGRSNFVEARKAFEAIYAADESGDLADNALFWIGETYFATRDYTNAMRYYRRIVADYGEANKAPDALLKTALAIEKTGDLALARKTLQQVIEAYPYSTAATTAKAELKRIRF